MTLESTPRAASNPPPLIEGGLLGLLRLLVRNRGLLWKYPLAITALVLGASFLFPNIYRSTVTILPPERDFQSLSQPTGDLKSFLSGGMALPVMATPSDILEAVLLSRTVRESTATRLDLPARWGMTRAEVLEELQQTTGSKVAPSGVVTFWVEYRNRWFADTLANTMVSIADRLNQTIVNTKASRTRAFVERRLEETRRQLDSAAAALEEFQKQHRTIALDVEVKAMVEGAATLRAQQTADEIELSVLRETLSDDHPRIRELSTRISQTRQKLSALESPVDDTARSYLGTGFAELPRLAQELAIRLRDVKVAEALYELLTQQYEHARIQERRDTPTFSVLDPASGGGEKVRPRRLLLGLATLLAALVLVAGVIVVRAWLDRLAVVDPERHHEIISLWQAMFRRAGNRAKELSPP
ncbi:MAG TPA: hypothetical protein VNN55_06790 [bacterium]|nr:hypothetical protein [bacterium]